jgi:hypothetical protein
MFYRNINDDSKSVNDVPTVMLQLVASFMILIFIKYRPLVYRLQVDLAECTKISFVDIPQVDFTTS